jgi:hypothetical protein
MKALELAVQSIATTETDAARRQRCVQLLDAIAQDVRAAADVWSGYLKKPGGTPASANSVMDWTGSAVAKKLFDLHLAVRAKENEITAGKSMLDDPLVELAYRKLHDGETGPAAAQQAVEALGARAAQVKSLGELIRTTVPKKAAAKAAAPKATVKAKPAAGKAPAAKKSAPKKPAAKKPAPKKKPAAKKKAAPKKKPAKPARKPKRR